MVGSSFSNNEKDNKIKKGNESFSHYEPEQYTNYRRTGIESYYRSAYGTGQSKHARHPESGRKKGFFLNKLSLNFPSWKFRFKSPFFKKVPAILGIVLLIGVGISSWYLIDLNSGLNKSTPEEKKEISQAITPRQAINKPYTIMLIGSDVREQDKTMGKRSDTNIIMRVDPETQTVTMLSIPRDTIIYDSDKNIQKFNAAYSTNGVAGTIDAAHELTGIEISNYMEINFNNLVELVDALGGVEVDVPQEINDPKAGSVAIKAGKQTLNGKEALVFARSRAYVDADFTRMSNQRILVQGIINKLLSLPPIQLPQAVKNASNYVNTDLSVFDIVNIVAGFKSNQNPTIYSSQLPSIPVNINGVSYVEVDEDMMRTMVCLAEQGENPNDVTKTRGDVSIGSALENK